MSFLLDFLLSKIRKPLVAGGFFVALLVLFLVVTQVRSCEHKKQIKLIKQQLEKEKKEQKEESKRLIEANIAEKKALRLRNKKLLLLLKRKNEKIKETEETKEEIKKKQKEGLDYWHKRLRMEIE